MNGTQRYYLFEYLIDAVDYVNQISEDIAKLYKLSYFWSLMRVARIRKLLLKRMDMSIALIFSLTFKSIHFVTVDYLTKIEY